MNKQTLELRDNPTLSDFQRYVNQMVIERGFDHGNVTKQFLQFTEEVGELAKAIRKSEKMSLDSNSHVGTVSEELADIFIYLLYFSNYFSIDLEQSFRDKEAINKQRIWR